MPPLATSLLRKQIAAGETAPLYMLTGDDDAEKSAVAGEFAGMVDEGLRAFNVERVYGGEIKVDDVVQAAATLPMMAPRRVVVILEAEKLLIPKREGKAADAEMERLEAFLKHPPDHATVVFVCGPLDRRRKMVALLTKQAQVVDCGTIEDAAAAERWVKARAATLGLTLEAAASRALVERAGIDMVRLRAGLERLSLYAMGDSKVTAQPDGIRGPRRDRGPATSGNTDAPSVEEGGRVSVTVEDVRQVVPVGPDVQENFGIANAIANGDARTALQQLGAALDGGAVPFFVMGQIRFAAERLPGPRLRSAIDAVFRTDLALKSSGGEPRILLERLVVELCGERKRR